MREGGGNAGEWFIPGAPKTICAAKHRTAATLRGRDMSDRANGFLNQVNGSCAAGFSRASSVIRAELAGPCRCSALGLTVDSYAPGCALARQLIHAGYDPNCTLEVYRGTTLCLRVPLAVAARLTVEDDRNGTPRFRQYRPPSWEVGPPVRKTAEEHRP
jgi:hypothetical protein